MAKFALGTRATHPESVSVIAMGHCVAQHIVLCKEFSLLLTLSKANPNFPLKTESED